MDGFIKPEWRQNRGLRPGVRAQCLTLLSKKISICKFPLQPLGISDFTFRGLTRLRYLLLCHFPTLSIPPNRSFSFISPKYRSLQSSHLFPLPSLPSIGALFYSLTVSLSFCCLIANFRRGKAGTPIHSASQ